MSRLLTLPLPRYTTPLTSGGGQRHEDVESKTSIKVTEVPSTNVCEVALTSNFITASGQKIGCALFVASPRSVTIHTGLGKLRFDLWFQTVYKLIAQYEQMSYNYWTLAEKSSII